MAERIVSAAAFFSWLKKDCGLNLPDNCTQASITFGTGGVLRIECEVIAAMTVDDHGNMPMVTKRYKLVEDDGDDRP